MDFKTLSRRSTASSPSARSMSARWSTPGGTSGVALFQVADLHRVRIYVRVPQAYLGALTPGLTATLRMPQYPGRDFSATLVTTSNAIAQDSRTALVELQADNPDGTLWPGTYTEVHFHIPGNPDALSIPASALMFGEHGVQVATIGGDQTVKLKNVQVGQDIGSNVQILSGMSESDRLIDSPLETLGDGDQVRVVKEGDTAAGVSETHAAGAKTD